MNHTREPTYEKSVRGFLIHKTTTKLTNYESHKRAHIWEIRSWILNLQSNYQIKKIMNHTREPTYEKSVDAFSIHKTTAKLTNYESHKRAQIREIRSWIPNSQSDYKISKLWTTQESPHTWNPFVDSQFTKRRQIVKFCLILQTEEHNTCKASKSIMVLCNEHTRLGSFGGAGDIELPHDVATCHTVRKSRRRIITIVRLKQCVIEIVFRMVLDKLPCSWSPEKLVWRNSLLKLSFAEAPSSSVTRAMTKVYTSGLVVWYSSEYADCSQHDTPVSSMSHLLTHRGGTALCDTGQYPASQNLFQKAVWRVFNTTACQKNMRLKVLILSTLIDIFMKTIKNVEGYCPVKSDMWAFVSCCRWVRNSSALVKICGISLQLVWPSLNSFRLCWNTLTITYGSRKPSIIWKYRNIELELSWGEIQYFMDQNPNF